jgi:DNA-binding IclR family transcriptional regulator
MLRTLVQRHPMRMSRSQLATLSGYSVKSSTVSSSLTALRNAGAIEEGDGLIWPSATGFERAGEVPEPPQPGELVHTWAEALSGGARAFFDELVNTHPHFITRNDLAERAGYSINSSTVSSSLTTLRRNGLLDESNEGIRLVDEVFA